MGFEPVSAPALAGHWYSGFRALTRRSWIDPICVFLVHLRFDFFLCRFCVIRGGSRHVSRGKAKEDVGGRAKPGHDDLFCAAEGDAQRW